MNTVFKSSNCLFVFQFRTVRHSCNPTTQHLLVFVILSRFYFEWGSKRFKIESGLNKFFFGNFLDDSNEVLDHIIIKYVFGLEFGKTFWHDWSPFLNNIESYRWRNKADFSFFWYSFGSHAFTNDGHLLVKVHFALVD